MNTKIRKGDPEDFIDQDMAKKMLGFKPSTPNSNRKLNELVRGGKIDAFQPSKKIRFYSKQSIVNYILSTKVPSDAEFVPVPIK